MKIYYWLILAHRQIKFAFLYSIAALMVSTVSFLDPSSHAKWRVVSRGQTLFRTEERVWDLAIEQLVAPHRGVRTNHSTVFSHMIPEVCD